MQRNRNIVLPNLLTVLGLLFGVYSMVLAMDERFVTSAVCIVIAAIFDGLDGKVARLIKGTSEFGIQLDSLADVVSFGVAPAILIYKWQLVGFNKLGIMAMFLYVACGALRLARFNVQTKVISNIFFVGMPIPAAAMTLVTFVFFINRLELSGFQYLPEVTLVLVIVAGLIMVSSVPYYSFKNVSFLKTHPFNTVVILVVIVAAIGIDPQVTGFLLLFIYLLSGFVMIPFRTRILNLLERDKGDKGEE